MALDRGVELTMFISRIFPILARMRMRTRFTVKIPPALTQNVTFENLKVNGNVITSASAGNFSIGNYTNNINFIASGGSVPAPTAIPSSYTQPIWH